MTEQPVSESWPAPDDVDSWAALANRALQLESAAIDQAESDSWAETVRRIVARELPCDQYVAERTAALDARLRQRKLAQANLRYKYGFKPGDRQRARRLIRLDVKAFLTRMPERFTPTTPAA